MIPTPLQRKQARMERKKISSKCVLRLEDLDYDRNPDENSMYRALSKHFFSILKPANQTIYPGIEVCGPNVSSTGDIIEFCYSAAVCDQEVRDNKQEQQEIITHHGSIFQDKTSSLHDACLGNFRTSLSEDNLKQFGIAEYNPCITLSKLELLFKGKTKRYGRLYVMCYVKFKIHIKVELLKSYVITCVSDYNAKKWEEEQRIMDEDMMKTMMNEINSNQKSRPKRFDEMDLREQYEYIINGGKPEDLLPEGMCSYCHSYHPLSNCVLSKRMEDEYEQKRRLREKEKERERNVKRKLLQEQDKQWVMLNFPVHNRTVTNLKQIKQFVEEYKKFTLHTPREKFSYYHSREYPETSKCGTPLYRYCNSLPRDELVKFISTNGCFTKITCEKRGTNPKDLVWELNRDRILEYEECEKRDTEYFGYKGTLFLQRTCGIFTNYQTEIKIYDIPELCELYDRIYKKAPGTAAKKIAMTNTVDIEYK